MPVEFYEPLQHPYVKYLQYVMTATQFGIVIALLKNYGDVSNTCPVLYVWLIYHIVMIMIGAIIAPFNHSVKRTRDIHPWIMYPIALLAITSFILINVGLFADSACTDEIKTNYKYLWYYGIYQISAFCFWFALGCVCTGCCDDYYLPYYTAEKNNQSHGIQTVNTVNQTRSANQVRSKAVFDLENPTLQ